MTSAEQVVRVYVCSAYQDMRAERAELHEVIFPRVRERFEQRGLRLEVIDPRWTAASEDEAEGIATLERALDQIDQCRPYFLGLFGTHPGKVLDWIPDEIGLKYPTIRHLARSARIHLETLHGALCNPATASHSFFYFRKPDFLKLMTEAERSEVLPHNPVALAKLQYLKEGILAAGRPVFWYSCRWDREHKRITGLEAFGRQVAADLLGTIGEKDLEPLAASPEEVDLAAPALVAPLPAELALPPVAGVAPPPPPPEEEAASLEPAPLEEAAGLEPAPPEEAASLESAPPDDLLFSEDEEVLLDDLSSVDVLASGVLDFEVQEPAEINWEDVPDEPTDTPKKK